MFGLFSSTSPTAENDSDDDETEDRDLGDNGSVVSSIASASSDRLAERNMAKEFQEMKSQPKQQTKELALLKSQYLLALEYNEELKAAQALEKKVNKNADNTAPPDTLLVSASSQPSPRTSIPTKPTGNNRKGPTDRHLSMMWLPPLISDQR